MNDLPNLSNILADLEELERLAREASVPSEMVLRLVAIAKAAGPLYKAYCSAMRSELDCPGQPWTPDSDEDEVAINARDALAALISPCKPI